MADSPLPNVSELWKPVPFLDGVEASNLGRVRAIVHPGGGTVTRLKVLKGERMQSGYKAHRIRGVRYQAHRLVCAAFHGAPPFEGATVDHLDGDRMNNLACNLEWVTRAENTRRQNADGRGVPKGEKHPGASLTDFQAECIFRLRGEGWKVQEIARLFCVSDSIIYKVMKGIRRPQAQPPSSKAS